MKQIESGAPADAFVPVDLKWMDYDVEKKVTGVRSQRRYGVDLMSCFRE
jgi:ABC-type molybdate transport system substrate-binding protein